MMMIEKEHKKSSLMSQKKEELVKHIMWLEHNNNALYSTLDTQAKNFQALSRWIPVEERLPDKDGFYLVTRALGSDSIVSVTWFSEKRKIWDLVATTSRGGVIAWQPLPKPYKPEETT